MNNLIVLFLIFAGVISLSADNIDSLEAVLLTQKGIERLNTLDKLARTYDVIDEFKRLQYAKEFLAEAQKSDIDSIIAKAYISVGIGFYYTHKTDSAAKYMEIALEKFREIGDSTRTAACLNNLGIFYGDSGNYKKALDKYFESLKINQHFQDSSGMAKAMNNIGTIYYDWKKFKKATEYFENTLAIHKALNERIHYALLYRNLGLCYFDIALEFFPDNQDTTALINNYFYMGKALTPEFVNDSSIKYLNMAEENLNTALELYKEFDDEYGVALVRMNMGVVTSFYGDWGKTLLLYAKALEVFINTNDNKNLARIYINMGIIHGKMGQPDKSIELLLKGLDFAEKQGHLLVFDDAYSALTESYMNKGNYKRALEYCMKLIHIRDKLINKESLQLLSELENKYAMNKKNAELELSRKNEKVLEQQKIILTIFLILLFIIIGGLFLRYRYKTRVNKLLKEKNKHLTNLNAKLEESEARLNEANIAKDKFFSIIAHDLRNPIGSFRLLTNTLSDQYQHFTDEEKLDSINELKYASEKLFLLLENLLTWAHTQRGKIECDPTDENLFTLVDITISHLKTHADAKKITIANNIPKDLRVFVDPNLTSTVIRNLVSNAIKFSDTGTTIEVYIKTQSSNKIELAIKDSGVGMSPEILANLFKVENTQSQRGTANESGTGLGLVICKEFIEKQGGEIFVESEIGKGSEFSFTIPKTETEQK